MIQRLSHLWLTVSLILTFTSGYFLAYYSTPPKVIYYESADGKTEVSSPLDLSLFWEVWDTIDKGYVEAHVFDEKKAMYGAIKGLVKSIDDPYTVFMDPKENEDFQASLDGRLEGIGAELSVEDGELVVVSPLKDSPAEKSGLKPKDIIYKIDGQLTNEMSLFDAIMSIRGEKGTKVVLSILRDQNTEPIDIEITRGSIEIDSVSYELRDNNVAYVSINQFSDTTQDEFAKITSKLLLDDAKALVLDLRYNGGGYLDISVDILSELIDGEKKVVTLKKRDENDNEVFLTDGNARLSDMPLVVLINQGSASASEIVAGAIQDYKRGYIIGEQSFGKGSVQEVVRLKDNSSLRMTIAKWLTPDGRDIDKLGITPNMVIGLSEKDASENKDPQLDAALDYAKNLIN